MMLFKKHMEALKHENIEPLGDGIKIIVSKAHKFNTDSILLANFASSLTLKNKNIIDLGTGCGIIPLMLSKNKQPFKITGVDINKQATNMFKRSVVLNNLEHKINVLHSDIIEITGKFNSGSFDLVLCNPPYKPLGTGILSKNEDARTARHETHCSLEDITRVSSKLLKFSGRLLLCQRPERLCAVIDLAKRYNLEPKRLRFVQSKPSSEPKLFLIECGFGLKEGLRVIPTLIIENLSGGYTDEMKSIYGDYLH